MSESPKTGDTAYKLSLTADNAEWKQNAARRLEEYRREIDRLTTERDRLLEVVNSRDADRAYNDKKWNELRDHLDEVRLERDELREAILNFCEGQRWAAKEWKNQEHIKPIFEIESKLKEELHE